MDVQVARNRRGTHSLSPARAREHLPESRKLLCAATFFTFRRHARTNPLQPPSFAGAGMRTAGGCDALVDQLVSRAGGYTEGCLLLAQRLEDRGPIRAINGGDEHGRASFALAVHHTPQPQ